MSCATFSCIYNMRALFVIVPVCRTAVYHPVPVCTLVCTPCCRLHCNGCFIAWHAESTARHVHAARRHKDPSGHTQCTRLLICIYRPGPCMYVVCLRAMRLIVQYKHYSVFVQLRGMDFLVRAACVRAFAHTCAAYVDAHYPSQSCVTAWAPQHPLRLLHTDHRVFTIEMYRNAALSNHQRHGHVDTRVLLWFFIV